MKYLITFFYLIYIQAYSQYTNVNSFETINFPFTESLKNTASLKSVTHNHYLSNAFKPLNKKNDMNKTTEFIELIKSTIPNYKNQLNIGCTSEQINNLEQQINLTLPASYKELLRFCNGEKEITALLGYFMLSVDNVISGLTLLNLVKMN